MRHVITQTALRTLNDSPKLTHRVKMSRVSQTPGIFTTIPPQPTEKKPGQLSEEEIKEYFEKGYILIPEFFTKEEIQPVLDSIHVLVDELAERLYNAGKITSKHKDATLYNRLTLLEKEFPGAAILLHKIGILPRAFQELWSNERLLNVIEQIIGPEISGHPVWNLRTKVPRNEQVTVPWHQDNAYLDDGANEVMIPTAWIPFLDTNKNNGCLEIAEGSHKKGYLAKHYCCAGPSHYVELKEENMIADLDVDMVKDIKLCEVPMGGLLLFNNIIPHRSLQNYSDQIRWSVDLRWCASDKSNCFYGLKENVLMRTAKDPNYKMDWEKFANENRTALMRGEKDKIHKEVDDFDTTIIGPWMGRWEIINHNKNTEKYFANKEQQQN